MNNQASVAVYKDALSKGLRAYQRSKSSGTSGHLTSLDGLLSHFPTVSHSALGIYEIPLSKIVGTYYHSRRKAFSKDFLPLESDGTEFASKWMNLYRAHITEGIRDPIVVYEYMNYYYVVEGNKRVSVLKYVDAHGIHAKVTRILPAFDPENEDIVNYYSFVDFHRHTGLYQLWLTRPRRWERLKAYLDAYQPTSDSTRVAALSLTERAQHFYKELYLPFRAIFHEQGGQRLPMTTAEALLLYIKLYGTSEALDPERLRGLMPSLLRELGNYGDTENLEIQTQPDVMEKGTLLGAVSALITGKKLRLGFVYARDIETSGWTYAHELGRRHLEAQFEGRIETQVLDQVPEDATAYEAIKAFCTDDQGAPVFDAVFTTSEIYRHATLKCALELGSIHFFNCSGGRPYVHMTNYYGRTYEARFIEGVIAGLSTQSGIVGYTATAPSPEVTAAANAFALGLRSVKPQGKLLVMFTGEWNNPDKTTHMAAAFAQYGADVVSNKTLSVPREVTKDYGVYSMLCTIDGQGVPTAYLAAPIWRWDSFYTRIVGGLLNGAYNRLLGSQGDNEKPHHFWWGMDAGVLDIYVDESRLGAEGIKLVKWLRAGLLSGALQPFEGPVQAQDGSQLVGADEVLTTEALMAMDQWVMGIEEIQP